MGVICGAFVLDEDWSEKVGEGSTLVSCSDVNLKGSIFRSNGRKINQSIAANTHVPNNNRN